MNTDGRVRLSYEKKSNNLLFFVAAVILIFCIWAFKYWAQLGFNLLFLAYSLTSDMRVAIIFYATMIRIILYPSALVKKHLSKDIEKTEEKYQGLRGIKKKFERDERIAKFVSVRKKMLAFSWFHLCFLTMNAVTIGYIFFQNFTRERLNDFLWTDLFMPKNFPINTTGYLPVVGQVDFSKPNMRLNFWSAVGAGVVGLVEILFNKKTSKRQLVKYLVFFPLGAYFLTYWVPCGFEFALIVFEVLTVGIILAEKLSKTKAFNMATGKGGPAEESEEQEE